MANKEISRRAFIKTAAALAGGVAAELVLPKKLVEASTEKEALTNLPVFYTQNTPIHIEHLTREGNPINTSYPANSKYAPNWITISDMPLDFLTPIRPESSEGIPNALGPIAWVTDIPHITGLQPPVVKAVVAYGNRDFHPSFINGSLFRKEQMGIISTYAYTDRLRVYPAKIYNLLTVLSSISEWQSQNGPFMPGKTYSYLEMAGVTKRNYDRYINLKNYLDAAGICASVATISKCVFLAGAKGLTSTVMRKMHKPEVRYSENRLDPAITKLNSDATVEWVLGSEETYMWNSDFKFKIEPHAPPMYFSFKAHLKLDDEPIDPKHPARHKMQPADARLTFTVSLVKDKPEHDKEINSLLSLRKEYSNFHNFADEFLPGFKNT
ncbi:hypothetical protein DRH13_01940 [Candidatus Woesebacteria bacterium]|nr:MAG: hypothetical protein DRH13_01940 [Candidatus Woesebacteria bacterium]